MVLEDVQLISLGGQGRAEVLRLMLIASSTPFVDHRVNLEQWRVYKRQEHLPDDAKLPLLRVNGGKQTVVGAVPIGRLIAEECGFYGGSKSEARQIDAVVEIIESLQVNITPVVRAALSKNFAQKKSAWNDFKTQTLNGTATKLNDLLAGKNFFVGERLSWADFVVAESMSRFSHVYDSSFIHSFPELKHHLARMERLPSLAHYLTDRAPATF